MSQKPELTTYHSYLRLDKVLSAQEPESAKRGPVAHDEMLFIIVHQAFELWFKEILFEIDSVRTIFSSTPVDEKKIAFAVARLHRVSLVQNILLAQFKVLETMTPLDFLDFRGYLERASGFQSYQFRILENKLGLDQSKRATFAGQPYHHDFSDDILAAVKTSEKEPSIFGLIEGWLERTPFLDLKSFQFVPEFSKAVDKMFAADRKKLDSVNLPAQEREVQLKMLEDAREAFESVIKSEIHQDLVNKGLRRLSHRATLGALFINLYRDEPILQLPFQLINSLVELDEQLALWRYQHALLVLRMLGRKVGTGRSSGYDYLKSTVERNRIFGDFANLSTVLIPRTSLPPLPPDVLRRLSFVYSTEPNSK